MPDLTFGLIGLALLPLVLVFLGFGLPKRLSIFRIILIPMSLLTSVIFFWQIAVVEPNLSQAAWGVNAGLLGIAILYLWVEGLGMLKDVYVKLSGGRQ